MLCASRINVFDILLFLFSISFRLFHSSIPIWHCTQLFGFINLVCAGAGGDGDGSGGGGVGDGGAAAAANTHIKWSEKNVINYINEMNT